MTIAYATAACIVVCMGVHTWMCTKATTWRDELVDEMCTAYAAESSESLQYQCCVATTRRDDKNNYHNNTTTTATTTRALQPTPSTSASTAAPLRGLHVQPQLLPPEHVGVLLSEVRRLASRYGNPLEPGVVQALHDMNGSTPATRYADMRVVADHAVDTQAVRAPWGSGDELRLDALPASLRYLVAQLQRCGDFALLGQLRHVYVLYTPHGPLHRTAAMPSWFDGHDYVLLPLRRDRADAVVTMVPMLRSRHARPGDVATRSWTSHDVDVRVPSGGAVRVYGKARYEYGWALRPSPVAWFGDTTRVVQPPSPPRTRHCASYDAPRQRTCTDAIVASSSSSSFARLRRLLGLSSASSSSGVQPSHMSSSHAVSDEEAAVLALHFEGPVGDDKLRKPWRQPQRIFYGVMPTPAKFAPWSRTYDSGEGGDTLAGSCRDAARHVVGAVKQHWAERWS